MKETKFSNLKISCGHCFIRSVEKAVLDRHMLEPGRSALVAVSGGPDSVALLCALWTLSSQYGWKLGAAHLNHCLRGEESGYDQAHAEALAGALCLPCYTEKADVSARSRRENTGIEEAGRKARYEFFNKIADSAGYDRIAVGHNRLDQAELVLINLLRGSGTRGLGAMAPVSGRIIRPLIDIPREMIEEFLRGHGISYRTDCSNRDDSFTRNRVRNRLIPELRGFNPSVEETLSRTASLMRDETEWAEEMLAPVYLESVVSRNPEAKQIVLDPETVLSLHRAARRRIVRKAVCEIKGNLRRIEHCHIDAVLSLAEKPGRAQIHLPDRIRAVKNSRGLVLRKEQNPLRSAAPAASCFAYVLEHVPESGEFVEVNELGCRFVFQRLGIHDMDFNFDSPGQKAWLDLDRVELPLVIRNPRPADRFMPLGMNGTMKIKDFFINNKISRTRRGRIPVIEGGGRILWVAGMRIDQRARITGATENVLAISFLSTDKDQ